jgi:hypothetical protein
MASQPNHPGTNPDSIPGLDFTGSPALQQLEVVLGQAADCLTQLSEAEWSRLCAAEAADLIATHQYFETFGYPDAFPPTGVLGRRIIELFTAKYPALAQDGGGTA